METHLPPKRPSYAEIADARMAADPTRLVQPTINVNTPPHDPGFYQRLSDHYADAAGCQDREKRKEIYANLFFAFACIFLGATITIALFAIWGPI